MHSRFVILEHTHHGVHFDLMLEVEGKLRTWRLPAIPEPGKTLVAEASFDHRLLYLNYEGPISGDRGQVRRVESGTFTGKAADESLVSVELDCQRLRGRLELRRCSDTGWEVSFTSRSGEPSRI